MPDGTTRSREEKSKPGVVSDEWERTAGRGAHRMMRTVWCSHMARALEGWRAGEGAACT